MTVRVGINGFGRIPHSSSSDLQFTMALGKDKSNFVKVVTWYDNEWGYSCHTADLTALMAKSL